MPDAPRPDVAKILALEREVQRLRIQARRLTDDLSDAEENARVYRRMAYNAVQKCAHCPLCNPRPYDAN